MATADGKTRIYNFDELAEAGYTGEAWMVSCEAFGELEAFTLSSLLPATWNWEEGAPVFTDAEAAIGFAEDTFPEPVLADVLGKCDGADSIQVTVLECRFDEGDGWLSGDVLTVQYLRDE